MKNARILVVEDEYLIAEEIQERLTRLHLIVAGTAASGEKALELAEQTDPDLVLMDIRLKGKMDGIDAGTQTRVLCMSGYSEDLVLRDHLRQPHFPFVEKPFTTSELTTRVREVLEQER